MTLRSPRIGWVHREAAHWIGLLGVVLTTVSILFTPLVRRFVPGFSSSVMFFWAAPITSVLASVLANLQPRSKGTLELGDDGLVWNEKVVPLAEIEGGLVRYRNQEVWLELALTGGRVLTAQAPDPEAANAFVEELGRRGLQRRLFVRGAHPYLTHTPPAARAGWLYAIFLVVLSALLATSFATMPILRLIDVALTLIGSYWLANVIASPGLAIGRDGITVSRAFSAEFVPWSKVVSVDADSRAILKTTEGLPVDLGPARARSEIAALVAQMRGPGDQSVDASAHLLDRSGRSVAAWREALTELGRDGGSVYRGVQLGREELERVLDDASAPAERRIGAALALANGDGKARIRVAAENTANEHLRIALERAAEGELDEGIVEDACRAESVTTSDA